jgi:hypothetical protein
MTDDIQYSIYKVRDKETGLFSTGGMFPRWKKGGKTWEKKGHLSSHFNLVKPSTYKNAEVVEIIVNGSNVTTTIIPIVEFVNAAEERAARRAADRERRIAKYELEVISRQFKAAQQRVANLSRNND